MENNDFKKTKRLALSALLFALAIILASFESTLPPVPGAVPGVKLGLSNIIVMYSLFFLGKRYAFTIAVLKALFVMSTKGLIAGFLSLFGGIISLLAMLLLIVLFNGKASFLLVSMFGAVFHNIGQFVAVMLVYSGISMLAYLPVLIFSGVAAGVVTATLLRFIMPALTRLGLGKRRMKND